MYKNFVKNGSVKLPEAAGVVNTNPIQQFFLSSKDYVIVIAVKDFAPSRDVVYLECSYFYKIHLHILCKKQALCCVNF